MHALRPRRKAADDDDRNPPSPAPPRRPPAGARRRRSDGGAGGAIRGEALDRRSGAAAARPHPDLDRQCPARRGRLRREARRRRRRGMHRRRPRRADRAVRRRHVARRPCQRALRRRVDRLLAHEPGARRPRRGPRLRRRAGRDSQGAQRVLARHGPVFSCRSRRRRLDRRHGGDARLRHQRGALRHDEGRRAVARRGDRRRIVPAHRQPGEEIRGGLRT